jgi:hypothetical protein
MDVLKINRDGEVLWSYTPRTTEKMPFVLYAPTADTNGNVFFSTQSGNIIGLNSDGNEIFVFLRNAFWTKLTEVMVTKNGNLVASIDNIGVVSFGKKEIQVFLDHLALQLTVAPINKDGTVLVPFRSYFEREGLEVGWDQRLSKITGEKPGLKIELIIGDKTAYINGVPHILMTPPVIENNTAFVPLRFIAESLNRIVSWNQTSSFVNIDRK